MSSPGEITWVILTTGTRPSQFDAAVASATARGRVVTVNNGGPVREHEVTAPDGDLIEGLRSEVNLGVPGGRDLGLRATSSPLVGFLDDDAVLRGDVSLVVEAFGSDPTLGAVSLRLVDEEGHTARRHVPRRGSLDPTVSGEVTLFLGGACAIRREAYEQVGGYFIDLFYGHEEVELSWRLIDADWTIKYLADFEVFHPRTEISRHSDGWRLTGRNRVWIARRTLPWPIALVHVILWFALGVARAPAGECRRAYIGGWRSGWRGRLDRHPISWRGVWRLTKLGRPPVI